MSLSRTLSDMKKAVKLGFCLGASFYDRSPPLLGFVLMALRLPSRVATIGVS